MVHKTFFFLFPNKIRFPTKFTFLEKVGVWVTYGLSSLEKVKPVFELTLWIFMTNHIWFPLNLTYKYYYYSKDLSKTDWTKILQSWKIISIRTFCKFFFILIGRGLWSCAMICVGNFWNILDWKFFGSKML